MSRFYVIVICMSVTMLMACTFEFGGKTYDISENGVKISDNKEDTEESSEDEGEAEDANQIPVVLNQQEEPEDVENTTDVPNADRIVIDSCGTDISVLYQYLPEDFPIPDCIIIDQDGSTGTRGETRSNHVYHFRTKEYTHEAIYDMYKDYLVNSGYEIVEDRITEDFRFFDLQGESVEYDVTVNSTFSNGEAIIGILFTIKH